MSVGRQGAFFTLFRRTFSGGKSLQHHVIEQLGSLSLQRQVETIGNDLSCSESAAIIHGKPGNDNHGRWDFLELPTFGVVFATRSHVYLHMQAEEYT